MCLFRKQREKKRLKRQIGSLMNDYDKEKIDGATYMQKMLDLTSSYQKKHKK
ncbi:MAG: hypothetical protein K6G63_09415 [Eubacterium sp.]|nr:hypothetical protein [Eubacterium sp.]